MAQELGPFHSPKRLSFSRSEVSPRMLQAGWAPWRRRQADQAGAGAPGAEEGEGWAGNSVTHVGPVCRSTMVAGTRCLLALLLLLVHLGGAAGLIPELGRRKFAASAGRSSSQPSDDVLSEFELRLLSMFGLKQRPNPSRDAVVPPYMLDLYRRHSGQPGTPAPDHRLERAASLANTVRSFHHEGEAWSRGVGAGTGAGSHPAKPPLRGQTEHPWKGSLARAWKLFPVCSL